MAKHGSIQHPLYSVSEVWWCILTIADLLMLEHTWVMIPNRKPEEQWRSVAIRMAHETDPERMHRLAQELIRALDAAKLQKRILQAKDISFSPSSE